METFGQKGVKKSNQHISKHMTNCFCAWKGKELGRGDSGVVTKYTKKIE
jgi:hypothetical protein